MKCPICQLAELSGGLTSISLLRDEMKFVISHVPAQVCPGCGEAYLDEQTAETVLLQARRSYESGLMESVIEYNILS